MTAWTDVSASTALVVAVGVVAVLVAGLVVALLALRRERRRSSAELAGLRDDLDRQLGALREELADSVRAAARPVAPAGSGTASYVITRVGEEPPAARHVVPAEERPDAATFADTVLRESVVQAASLVRGVRHGLRPEVRDRIRGEMRRELRRARRRRKAETRQARRAWAAQQAGPPAESGAA